VLFTVGGMIHILRLHTVSLPGGRQRPTASLGQSPYTRPVYPHHRWQAGPHVSSTHAGKAV